MILPYEYPKNDGDASLDDINDKSLGSISIKLSNKSISSSCSKESNNENLFVFDVKNSNFAKNNPQTGDNFFEKFEDLKLGNLIKNGLKSDLSSSNNDSQISAIKEENFINTDVLKLLNASNKGGTNSEINASAIIEDIKLEKLQDKIPDEPHVHHVTINKTPNIKEEEKMSLNTSILSDISQSSKNFIPKELLLKDSPFKKNTNLNLNNFTRENTNQENRQPAKEIARNFFGSNNNIQNFYKTEVPEEIYPIEQPELQEEFIIDYEEDDLEVYGNFYSNIQAEKQNLFNHSEYKGNVSKSKAPQNFNSGNIRTYNENNLKMQKKHFSEYISDNHNINNINNINKSNNFTYHPDSDYNFNGMNPNRIEDKFREFGENSLKSEANKYITQINSSLNNRANSYYMRDIVDKQTNNFSVGNKILNGGWSNNTSSIPMHGTSYDASKRFDQNIKNLNMMNLNADERDYKSNKTGNKKYNNQHYQPQNFTNFKEIRDNETVKQKNYPKRFSKNSNFNSNSDFNSSNSNKYPKFNPYLENEDFIQSQNSPQTRRKMNRPTNISELSEEELVKYLHILAREQTGCRFLQQKLEEDPYFADRVLFPAIFDFLLELTIDAFGNYLIQKMMEYNNQENLLKILNLVCPCMLSLGLNSHGTRVIQKLIECVESNDLFDIFLSYFNPIMLDLMKDINGNHVIIKFVSTVSGAKNSALYEAVTQNIVEIATNKHACCAFQKCIDFATPEQRANLIDKLIDSTYILMSDPYGNYVLQYIIMLNDFNANHKIAQVFKNNIGYLSKQKFSSNVIEKCFDHCDENTKFMIVKEVCNPKITVDLLMDMYGNYVLQKALACAKDPYRKLLINSIGPDLERLKTVNFGPKLYTKLLLTYPELNSFLYSNKSVQKNQKNKKGMSNNVMLNNFSSEIQKNFGPINNNTNFRQEMYLNMGNSNSNNLTNMSQMNNTNFYPLNNFGVGQGNFNPQYAVTQQQGYVMPQNYNLYNNQNMINRHSFYNTHSNFDNSDYL